MTRDSRLEDATCILCGPAASETVFAAPPHRVVRCRSCGLVYLSPRLHGGARRDLYEGDYFRSPVARERGYTDYVADGDCYDRTFRRRARPFLRWRERGSVFEPGCAAGYFLRVMEDAGWSAHGVEPNAEVAAYGREVLGVGGIEVGAYEGWDGRGGPYDLVALWDVLEHVGDPLDLLRRARGWLKPDGRLVVETQDVESWAARLLGPRWHHYKHGEHIYHFSPRTLGTLLERAGFQLAGWTRRGAGKIIPWRFVVERMERVAPGLHPVLARLPLPAGATFYVNPHDEMIVTARPDPAFAAAAR